MFQARKNARDFKVKLIYDVFGLSTIKRSEPINIIPLSMNGRAPGPLYRNPPFLPSGLPLQEAATFGAAGVQRQRGATNDNNTTTIAAASPSTAQINDNNSDKNPVRLV